jgi:hypothetical protein
LRRVALLALLALAFACGGDDDDGGNAIDAAPDAVESFCGFPGDVGNSKGVGKFCNTIGDCSGQEANLCATLGDPMAHFCTAICDPAMPVADECGEDTTCECSGSNCGCTPTSCTQ